MKKKTNHTLNDELRPEYAFASMKRGIRGKYAGCQQGAAAAEARCAPARSQAREEGSRLSAAR